MNQLSLLNWMLLATALLGAWWLCYRLALRPERSFAYNRAFLVLGPLLAAGLPLVPLAWPAGWWGPGPAGLPGMVAVVLPVVQVGATEAAAGATRPDWSFWLLVVYATGAVLVLLRLAAELGRLWWQARDLPRTAADGYTLVQTHGRLPTSSFGRVIFWDETLALRPAEARQVLAHELAHLRQHHTHDRLLLELLRAMLWFNPFVHLCARALALTHEYLADEAALHESSLPTPSLSTSYSQLLARQVASRLGFSVPLAHSFSHSQTLSRIAMIQKTNPVRRWKQWLVLPLVAILLTVVASGQTAAQSGPPAMPKPTAVLREGTPPPPPPAPDGQVPAQPSPPVYTYVEKMPQLPAGGGNKAIIEYIQYNLVYPKVKGVNRKEGMVFVSFIVTNEGAVQETKIVKGLAKEYDDAVLAAVQKLPKFTPGRQAGKPVFVSFTVPIQFAQ